MRKIVCVALMGLLVFATMNGREAQSAPQTISKGKKVAFDYTLTVDGQVIESSSGKGPMSYVHGTESIIPGLERQFEGLTVGDEKSVMVAANEGYGEIDPMGLREVPKSSLPPQFPPQPGMILETRSPDGNVFPAVVTEVKADTVVLNFNHPLAGKVLNFQIKVVSIE